MANYLYNGVELPSINTVWMDKEMYPYAVITNMGTGMARLYVSNSPFYHTSTVTAWGTSHTLHLTDSGTVLSYLHDTIDTGDANTGWAWRYEENIEIDVSDTDFVANTNQMSVLWSNTDILNTDGSLYLAASTPIPVLTYDRTALVQGWIVGKTLAAMRGKRTPVAYLYNGVRLPALPEWDKETYPYVMACWMNGNSDPDENWSRVVYGVADKPRTVHKSNFLGNEWDSHGVENSAYTSANYYPTIDPNNWNYIGEETTGEITYSLEYVFWANYDIYTSDGELYLAASDPVPVYE